MKLISKRSEIAAENGVDEQNILTDEAIETISQNVPTSYETINQMAGVNKQFATMFHRISASTAVDHLRLQVAQM